MIKLLQTAIVFVVVVETYGRIASVTFIIIYFYCVIVMFCKVLGSSMTSVIYTGVYMGDSASLTIFIILFLHLQA